VDPTNGVQSLPVQAGTPGGRLASGSTNGIDNRLIRLEVGGEVNIRSLPRAEAAQRSCRRATRSALRLASG